MATAKIMRIRAATHKAIAAFARVDAELEKNLPIGTRVSVLGGKWFGTVTFRVLPFDGSIGVTPDSRADIKFFFFSKTTTGAVLVHVDNIDFANGGK